jgi:hypothetical protein
LTSSAARSPITHSCGKEAAEHRSSNYNVIMSGAQLRECESVHPLTGVIDAVHAQQ